MQQAIICPRCGTPNAPGQRFCGACGTVFSSSCPNCGAMIEPGGRFCGNCGAVMPGEMQQQQPGWGQQQYGGMPQQQQGWGQQQYGGMPQQQQGWGQQQYGGMPQQQQGWGQQPMQPPPPPMQPPAWGQQQYGGMPQQPWGQSAQKSASGLIALLIFLLIGLGGFAWWAFFGSPPWGGSSSGSSGSTSLVTSGPFVFATASGDAVTCSIKWDTASDVQGQIEYGTSETYGSKTDFEASATKSHSVSIPGLKVDTSYFYRVNMKDKSGKVINNPGSKFKTPKPVTEPPATPPTS